MIPSANSTTATTSAAATPRQALKAKAFDLVLAFIQSQCVYTATRLGIFNLLQDEGEQEIGAIAQKTGIQSERLYFILRALAHLDVLQEKPGQVFAPTALSALFVTHQGPSMGHFALHLLEPAQWDAWKVLEEALHTGEVPFERANGQSVYQFCQDNSWSGEVFINAMSFLTDHATGALLDVYDFSRFPTVMDVGGGQGGLIAQIVKRYGCRGMLFEVPYVAAAAPAYLAQQGITAVTILQNCRQGINVKRDAFPRIEFRSQEPEVSSLLNSDSWILSPVQPGSPALS